MKIVCPRQDLVDVLGRICGVIPQKPANEVFSYVLVEAAKKTVHWTGTDGELAIVASSRMDVKEDGAVILPAAKLFDIVRELPAASVEIDADEKNRASIRCARSRFSLTGRARDEYPILPSVGKEAVFKMTQPALRDLIRRTSFAAAGGSDARSFLMGGCMIVYGNSVRMVATDGHRLALAQAPLTGQFKRKVDVIVPLKALQEIQRNLCDEGSVEIAVGGNQIVVDVGEARLTSRLVAEQFPNYEQVIPKSHDRAVKVRTEALHDAIRRVSLLADQKSNAVRLRVAKDRLHVAASDREMGEANEEVEAVCEGNDLEIAFKGHYLTEALRTMAGCTETVRVEFSGPLAPATIRPLEDSDYIVVIMPMRV